jgi:hypothetical protein
MLFGLLALVSLLSVSARAASVTLAWLPSTDPGVAGYNLHYGLATQTYTSVIAVGGATNATISGLVSGAEYFFSVTAVNGAGVESQFSNEIAYKVPGGSGGGLPIVGEAQFSYITNDSTITITGYTGPGGAVAIPDTINSLPVTGIADDAFNDNTNLAGVTIPNTVISIGDDAFYGCSSLAQLTIPDSVTSIGAGAFSRCSSLVSIVIPGAVTNIGENAFGSCAGLMAITVDATNALYSSTPDGTLFNKKQSLLIQCPGGKAGGYTVPAGVTGIGNYALYGCSSLTSLTLPASVASLGNGAMGGCSSLRGVYFQGNAPAAGSSVFAGDDAAAYYLAGTEGWSATFAGIPAFLWDPVVQATYTASNGAITITSYTGPGGAVAIPETINGLPVTGIGDSAFFGCTNVASVTLPNTLTSIGAWAFSDCTRLAGITIPGSVTTIGDWAFEYCTNLAGITIPDSVTSIGEGAFDYCTGMTAATMGNGVTDIGSYAFEYCTNLTAAYFQGNAPAFGSSVFAGAPARVYYLAGTTGWGPIFASVPASLWDPQSQLAYTVAGGQVTVTGYTGPGGVLAVPGAITGLPVTTIADWAFFHCTTLTAITLPNSIIGIGMGAFYGCTNLASVTIPNSVTGIGNEAFYGCANLTALSIPWSVTSIGIGEFVWCVSLTSITVDPLNPVYSSVDGVLFDKSQTELLAFPPGIYGSYGMPQGVASIGDWAFDYCTNLIAVMIPASVTYIGQGAFSGCTNLIGVFFQGNAPTWDPSAFSGDDAPAYYQAGTTGWGPTFGGVPASLWDPLTQAAYTVTNGAVTITKYTGPGGSVAIPATITGLPVTGIGDSAFSGCTNLTAIVIPDSVTNIGDAAFYGCTNLPSVTLPPGITSLADQLFYGCSSLTNVAMPAGLTRIGHEALANCSILANVVIPDTVTVIGDWAFESCTNLASLALPGGVANMGEAALWGCSRLSSVTIPNSVTSLSATFGNCASLTNVTIPDSVTNIGVSTFYGCSNLAGITIPSSVVSLGDEAFVYCTSLTNISIPGSVTSIGSWQFAGCASLRAITVDPLNPVYSSVDGVLFDKNQTVLLEYPAGVSGAYTLPGSVASIGSWAFEYCANVTKLTIPEGVTNVGDAAFYGCTGLTNVYFQGNAPDAGWEIFDDDSNATVYYLPARTGWSTAFAGRPTVSVGLFLPVIGTVTVDEMNMLTVIGTATVQSGQATLGYSLVNAPPGMAIDTNGVITWNPQQVQSPGTNIVTISVTDADPSDTANPRLIAFDTFTVIVAELNAAPVLPLIATQTVNELTLLLVTNTATESNIHATLGYALANAPAGMGIDANGIIRWTPQQSQSPSTNLVTTIVTNTDPYDLVNPYLSATNTFTVIVNEVNAAPVLPIIPTQTIIELSLLTVTNAAVDDNIHSTLSYALANPPPGMTIGSNGVIRWTPSAPGTNVITTVAASSDPYDLINPVLTATNSFLVQVVPPVQLDIALVGGQPQLTWNTVAGWSYQVWCKDALADASWVSLGGVLTASGETLAYTDSTADGTSARFYRVQALGSR